MREVATILLGTLKGFRTSRDELRAASRATLDASETTVYWSALAAAAGRGLTMTNR
jgi:hypothetical protein